MSFPANAIGLGSAALAGVYYKEQNFVLVAIFVVLAIIFGLIFS